MAQGNLVSQFSQPVAPRDGASLGWRCATCGLTTVYADPVEKPARCTACGNADHRTVWASSSWAALETEDGNG